MRSLLEGRSKAAIRVFPPTNLTTRAIVPSVAHPIGNFPIEYAINGVVQKQETSMTRWRLKKLMWRIEEQCVIKSKPCIKHKNKIPATNNDTESAIQHTTITTLGSAEHRSGWKTDFDPEGGESSCQLDAALLTKANHHVNCNVDSPSGMQVTHQLFIELIIAEEFISNKNPNVISPTGAARVLRMGYPLIVTERPGLGISWDEEQPPQYDDVPRSPPRYHRPEDFRTGEMMFYAGPDDYCEAERMQDATGSAARPESGDQTSEQPAGSARPASSGDEAGPSTRRQNIGRWTDDDLISAEPQQWRSRQESVDSQAPEEDHREGINGAAATEDQP